MDSVTGGSILGGATVVGLLGWAFRFLIGRSLKKRDEELAAMNKQIGVLFQKLDKLEESVHAIQVQLTKEQAVSVTNEQCSMCRDRCEQKRTREAERIFDRLDNLAGRFEKAVTAIAQKQG